MWVIDSFQDRLERMHQVVHIWLNCRGSNQLPGYLVYEGTQETPKNLYHQEVHPVKALFFHSARRMSSSLRLPVSSMAS